MDVVLFISPTELKQSSLIDGQVDNDKILFIIESAQDMHIQNILGTNLYRKLSALKLSGDIDLPANEAYKTLLEEYIKKVLIWSAQKDYVALAAFQISNGGVFKHLSENSQSVTLEDIQWVMSQVQTKADFYQRRFLDYICGNSSDYPEYSQLADDGMAPDQEQSVSTWNI